MAARRRPRELKPGSRTKEATIAAATDGLDDRERLFVYHYITTLDPQHAALLAGYSQSTAIAGAYQWVSTPDGAKGKPRVYEAIQKAMQKHFDRLEISAERVLNGLAELAFSNPLDFGDVDEHGTYRVNLAKTSRSQFGAVQEMSVYERRRPPSKKGAKDSVETTTKLKLADKRPALVDLGRHLGVFKDEGGAGTTVHLIIKGAE